MRCSPSQPILCHVYLICFTRFLKPFTCPHENKIQGPYHGLWGP